MKAKLSRLLVVLGLGHAVLHSAAEQFTFGIDRSTGRLIATDVWNSREHNEMAKDSGRIDEKRLGLTDEAEPWHYRSWFFLGNTFELDTNGTRLEATMIIGFYALPGYSNPNQFISHFWVEASDGSRSWGAPYNPYDAGSLGAAYYGYAGGYPDHFEDHKPISLVKVEALSHEKTKAGEVLWILKVNYSLELERPIDFIPDIQVDFSIGASGSQYYINHMQHRTTAAEVKGVLQNNAVSTNHLALASKPHRFDAVAPLSSNVTTISGLPEITLSIIKQGGFLVITFSPVVANANLEQANMNSYPWAWQPAVTTTNSLTNGWYVVPTLEPRVFRVRIDR